MKYPPHALEDLALGDAFVSEPRVVDRDDIRRFAEVSGDWTALHTDEEYARTTPLGGLVAHGALSLSIATGHCYALGIFERTVIAVREMQVRYAHPVRPGDALTLTLTVESLTPQPRRERGLATFAVQLANQDGRTVLSGSWVFLLRLSTPASSAEA